MQNKKSTTLLTRCRQHLLGLLVVALLGFPAVPCPAERLPEVDEYQAKAALLYVFAKFVTWPEGTGSVM